MAANMRRRENPSNPFCPISGLKFEIENGRGGRPFHLQVPAAGYNHPSDFPFSSQSDLDRREGLRVMN
jgi:hypothetical protein